VLIDRQRGGDVGQPPVTEVEQVIGRQLSAADVVHTDRAVIVSASPEQNDRHAAFP
jgi:hypothetical protein